MPVGPDDGGAARVIVEPLRVDPVDVFEVTVTTAVNVSTVGSSPALIMTRCAGERNVRNVRRATRLTIGSTQQCVTSEGRSDAPVPLRH